MLTIARLINNPTLVFFVLNPVIERVLRAHAKVDKLVRRGAKVIANIAAASRECAEVLVDQGARAVLEDIMADPNVAAGVKTVAQNALRRLVLPS